MKPAQLDPFTYISQRAAEVAHACHNPATSVLGQKLALMLKAHFAETFPEEDKKYGAIVQERRAAQAKGATVSATEMEEIGRALWDEIHTRALEKEGKLLTKKLKNEEVKVLVGIARRLPHGCTCRADYLAYLREHPPTLDGGKYFAWTVGLHNHVNAKLKRSIWSERAARELWSRK